MKNLAHWKTRYPKEQGIWISHVAKKDLSAIIKKAFCLMHLSTEEGYGYPPFEAMVSCVPATVTNIPLIVETTSRCALIANPYDSKTWTKAIDTLKMNLFTGSKL